MNYILAALVVLVAVVVILAYRHQAWMKTHCVCDSGKHGGKHGGKRGGKHGGENDKTAAASTPL